MAGGMFNTYMKLHHSQTEYTQANYYKEFNTYMKLHHSQTCQVRIE